MKTIEDVCSFLKATETYYLATMDGGKPQVRPFGTAHLFGGKLYIQTGLKKDVAKQIAKNPHIAMCAFDGKTWLRVSATAVLDPRLEAQQSMLEAYPSLQGMYKAGDGNTAVYYLKDATATFSSFTSAPETVTF
ncbi:MAG: pyridoxamine 5'-phosphate oxidase family protein [Sphaerochaetaceae bacterium]|nr:pyridoxamine 5'-phosphate oxidase family protein [Spirochaetales bacterium]MDY5500720.1 pyridoxamine 5'-phosphate oxidase family protein [Sphaerochaetaceae bacterium]